MTEYVFRPSRSGVSSRMYSGRYRIDGMERERTVSLKTTDKQVAKKRLRDFIVAAQRAAEGLVAPLSERQAAATPLAVLVLEFVADLRALGRDSQYISDTRKRLDRIFLETGWKRLIDIRADVFTAWRATLTGSAKTRKHYQADLMNFLNWLVRLDRLGRNPLAKVTRVSTRGKQVRKARAYTPEELRALFDSAPRRRPRLVRPLPRHQSPAGRIPRRNNEGQRKARRPPSPAARRRSACRQASARSRRRAGFPHVPPPQDADA